MSCMNFVAVNQIKIKKVIIKKLNFSPGISQVLIVFVTNISNYSC